MTDNQARRDQVAEVLYGLTWTSEFADAEPELQDSYRERAGELLASDVLAQIVRDAKAEALRVIESGPILRRWIDDSELVDLANVRAALDEPTGEA